MWKMLIADDEPIIREGLKHVLDWERYDIQIIGEAEDGEIAYDMVAIHRPDIILLDICMPFLNGLELIERIRVILPEVVIIIVSGHDEFEYAQKAVRLEVADFILKPVDEEEIRKSVERVIARIESREEAEQMEQIRTKAISHNFRLIKERFIVRFLEGSSHIDRNAKEYYGLDYKETSLILIRPILKMNIYDKHPEFGKELLFFSICNIAEEIGAMIGSCIAVSMENQYVAILVNNGDDSIINQYCQRIEEEIIRLLEHDIYRAYCVVNEGLKEISVDYQKLKSQIERAFTYTPVITRAKAYIETHYEKSDLCLDEVANYVKMNPSYLSRLLKTETGNSFIEFLTKIRIEKSKQLLKQQRYKIYEIADMTGYKSQHYFSKAFKKVVRMSPKQYMNRD